MAANLWADDDMFGDDDDRRGSGSPTSSSPGGPVQFGASPASGGSADDVRSLYRSSLGRDPDERELASEIENVGKYGLGQLRSNLEERRGNSTTHRPYNSQTDNPYEQEANRVADARMPQFSGARSGFQIPGAATGGAPSFAGQFDDPGSKLIEQYALGRFHELQDPNPSSGTALFEKWLRDLVGKQQTQTPLESELPNIVSQVKQPSQYEQYVPEMVNQLKAPVYSDQESSQLKARVYDDIEVQRQQTKQRWIEEISRRGFQPSSGPALEGLLRIDEQFNTMRTVADREFAVNAIGVRENRRGQIADALLGLKNAQSGRLGEVVQALSALGSEARGRDSRTTDALSSLHGSENERQDKALTYAKLPKQLSDNAFQQGLQLVGAGGNPQSMLNSALSIYQTVANNNRIQRDERDASLEAIFEYLAGLG